jgi:hypothetical protein
MIFLLFPVIYSLNIAVDSALGGWRPGMTQLRSLIDSDTLKNPWRATAPESPHH